MIVYVLKKEVLSKQLVRSYLSKSLMSRQEKENHFYSFASSSFYPSRPSPATLPREDQRGRKKSNTERKIPERQERIIKWPQIHNTTTARSTLVPASRRAFCASPEKLLIGPLSALPQPATAALAHLQSRTGIVLGVQQSPFSQQLPNRREARKKNKAKQRRLSSLPFHHHTGEPKKPKKKAIQYKQDNNKFQPATTKPPPSVASPLE